MKKFPILSKLKSLSDSVATVSGKVSAIPVVRTTINRSGSAQIHMHGSGLILFGVTDTSMIGYYISNNTASVVIGSASASLSVTASSNVVTITSSITWNIGCTAIGFYSVPEVL